jgi:hypothetical protein
MEDYTSPRVTALSLVAQLCRKRKAASLPPCLEFCRDRFAAFEAGSESPSALDGALFLFGSLGAHFADAKAPPRPRASPALAPRLGAPRPFMALFVSVHGAGASVLSIHGAVRVRSRRRRVRLGRRRRRARPPRSSRKCSCSASRRSSAPSRHTSAGARAGSSATLRTSSRRWVDFRPPSVLGRSHYQRPLTPVLYAPAGPRVPRGRDQGDPGAFRGRGPPRALHGGRRAPQARLRGRRARRIPRGPTRRPPAAD